MSERKPLMAGKGDDSGATGGERSVESTHEEGRRT
jgi:hypothetical protein